MGWIYGLALLVTVASVDTGVVSYLTTLLNNVFGTSFDGTKHSTILVVTVALIVVQTLLNTVGAKVMGVIARMGVYVETVGTFGVAIALGIAGFHHGLDFLFTTHGAAHVASNPLGVDFQGKWLTGAALVAILAHSYIFYGFESAGDVAEETRRASHSCRGRCARRCSTAGSRRSCWSPGCCWPCPPTRRATPTRLSFAGGVPAILAQLPSWAQNLFLLIVCIAFFSCGTAVQGAGSRLTYSYARDGAVPASGWMRRVSPRFHTPANALLVAGIVPVLFTLLVNINPTHDVHILWFVFPAGINALTALVSFGVSGIYLSFLLTVIGSMIARARGWQPGGPFTLGRWAWPVSIAAVVYLVVMLVNIVLPSGLTSPRGALFNFDWITLAVVVFLLLVGALYFFSARPDRRSGFVADEVPAVVPGDPALPAVPGTEPTAADPRP